MMKTKLELKRDAASIITKEVIEYEPNIFNLDDDTQMLYVQCISAFAELLEKVQIEGTKNQ